MKIDPRDHWLDCLVGCAVGASMCGVALPNFEEPKPRKRWSLKDIQEMAQRGKGKPFG